MTLFFADTLIDFCPTPWKKIIPTTLTPVNSCLSRTSVFHVLICQLIQSARREISKIKICPPPPPPPPMKKIIPTSLITRYYSQCSCD